jgi:hypothetical protein
MASYEETACHKGNWKSRAVAFVANNYFIGDRPSPKVIGTTK